MASNEEATRIATLLLQRRLVACVQVAGLLASHYWWQGALESATEYVLIAKTTVACADAATEALVEAHSYDVPEVLITPVLGGNAAYLAWVANEVAAPDDP